MARATRPTRSRRPSGNPSAVSKAIPAGKLVDGGTYVWQARTYDGTRLRRLVGDVRVHRRRHAAADPASVASTRLPGRRHAARRCRTWRATFTVAPPAHAAGRGRRVRVDAGLRRQLTAAPDRAGPGRTSVPSITVTPMHDGVQHAAGLGEGPRRPVLRDAGDATRSPCGPEPVRPRLGRSTRRPATPPTRPGTATTLTLSGGATRVAGRAGVGRALVLNGSVRGTPHGRPGDDPHPDTGAATPVRTDPASPWPPGCGSTATGGTGQRTVMPRTGRAHRRYTLGYSAADNKWRFTMAGVGRRHARRCTRCCPTRRRPRAGGPTSRHLRRVHQEDHALRQRRGCRPRRRR